MIKKRIGILTGGGDVPPLNAMIASARQASLDNETELLGFFYGWLGLIDDRYVELSKINIDPKIGGTILKSSRVNLEKIPGAIEKVQNNFKKLRLQGLIVVGGEDTLSNSFYLPDIPQVLISKTIDNDVGMIQAGKREDSSVEIINYFTLGFPTAAKKISSFVSLKEGLRTTAYSHERIMFVESMGMHAGWLALSSCMGHPDFIVIPEFPLDYNKIINMVLEKYELQRNVIIVVAEGARFDNGAHISADENEKDDFGHPRFKGSAEMLARRMKEDLKNYFDTRNINAVNPSYLYRSGMPSDLDFRWASKIGKKAVNMLSDGLEKPVFLTIRKVSKRFSITPYPLCNLKNIQEFHRFVDKRFYNPEEYSVTELGKKYLAELVDEICEDKYGLI
ncbi:MAG: 6-phosphofructokinase [Syntrophaceae bacterium]|nr:6-phosphofructokinase [Syntrophaceae bacterium]